MRNYLKLAAIVLLFIAGSAVESHANLNWRRPTLQEQNARHTQQQYQWQQRQQQQQRDAQNYQYQQRATRQRNTIQFNQNYPDYYPGYR